MSSAHLSRSIRKTERTTRQAEVPPRPRSNPVKPGRPLSGYARYGTWAYLRRLERAYVEWLHGRARFSHFVTLSFQLVDSTGQRITQKMLEDAVRNFQRRLVCNIHGRRRIKFRPPIRSVVTVDWGEKGNNPHAHLMLETPVGMSYGQFSVLVKKCANRVRLIEGGPHIRSYEDADGAKYLVNHGTDRMIVTLFDTPHT